MPSSKNSTDTLNKNQQLVKAKEVYEQCLKKFKVRNCKPQTTVKTPPKKERALSEYNQFVREKSKDIKGKDRLKEIALLWQEEQAKKLKRNKTK